MNRELWTCPVCGRMFRICNQEHTCGKYDLDIHFQDKHPVGQTAFDWILEVLGDVMVLPMKTTIAFERPFNIAFLSTKKKSAVISFILARALDSPRVMGTTDYGSGKTIYRVRILDPGDLDAELRAWLEEAGVAGAA